MYLTPPNVYSQFLLPPHSTRLDMIATLSVPLRLDTQQYWVIRSCCWRTRRASSDRRAFASDSGTGVEATVIVKSIVCIGQ